MGRGSRGKQVTVGSELELTPYYTVQTGLVFRESKINSSIGDHRQKTKFGSMRMVVADNVPKVILVEKSLTYAGRPRH